MLRTTTEPFGTTWLVAKKIQAKFYVDEGLMDRCGAIFEAQGVNLSEGMTRLVELLVNAGDTLTPLLLRQAPGEAGRVLAEHVLKSSGSRKQPREAPVILQPGQALRRQPKRGQSPPPEPQPASKGPTRGPTK